MYSAKALRNGGIAAGALIAGGAFLAGVARKRRAVDVRGWVALITGGSRGLGLLIARELGRQGARIILVARDEAELQRARQDLASRHVDASIIVADVGDEEQASRAIADAIKRCGRLDVLVNNAGVIKVGPLDHMTEADFEEAMAVHFWGPLHMMRAAIPHMRQQGAGRIVNISSIGGKIGVPHLAAYSASKFALTGLSDAVRAELAQDGILVTTVCPGLMRTGSPFNAWFKGQHRQEFAWFAIADSLPGLSIDARRAAWQVVDALRHGDAELIITWPARLATLVTAIMPKTLALAMAMTNRLLPSPAGPGRNESHRGWQSGSAWAPSLLTRLNERAAGENNEFDPAVSATSASSVA